MSAITSLSLGTCVWVVRSKVGDLEAGDTLILSHRGLTRLRAAEMDVMVLGDALEADALETITPPNPMGVAAEKIHEIIMAAHAATRAPPASTPKAKGASRRTPRAKTSTGVELKLVRGRR